MKKLTPIQNKKLIATKNILRCKSASSQFAQGSATLNLGSGDFTVSCLGLVTNNAVQQQILHIVNGSNRGFNIHHRIIGNQLFYVIADSGNQYGSNVTPLDNNVLYRFTIIRRGSNLEYWINEKLFQIQSIIGGDTFNLGFSNLYIGCNSGSANFLDGLVGNVIVLKDHALTDSEFSYIHKDNVLPPSIHQYVVLHIPCNQIYGDKAYDVVEQYNYSKVTPINAVHSTLINYTADEMGTTNPLLQTAWYNLYSKIKQGNFALKLDGSSIYSNIPSFTDVTLPQWTLVINFFTSNDITTFASLFGNQVGADIEAEFVRVYVGSGQLISYFGTYTPGSYIINSNTEYQLIISCDGVDIISTLNGMPYWNRSGLSPNVFDVFEFGRDPKTLTRWFSGSYSRAVLINSSAFIGTYNFQLLGNMDESDFYKSIPGIQFDIDFGNVFQLSGNYYARDNSGNNHHARLYNFNPAIDQPLRIEQSTGLPEKINALRFVSSENHYLSISSFNPTKEKGYTHIIGMSLNANRTPTSKEALLSKFDGTNYKVLRGEVINSFNFYDSGISQVSESVSIPSITPDSVTYYVLNQKLLATTLGRNGNDEDIDNTASTFNGYNEIGGNLLIGANSTADGFLNGYMYFVGIWKGVLTKEQILNIINNTLGANDSKLMPDCQLYLNFEEILVNGSTYTIKDWSPQNHTVTLNNYTANEVNPAHADYKLIELNSLR